MEEESTLKVVSVANLLPVSSVAATSNGTSIMESSLNEPSALRKRESLEQLSTNALPPYVPDLSPYIDGEPVKTHCCRACGDTYIVKSNFDFHINRRSVLIHFKCDSCEEVQVFYNRCRLLSHISDHVDKGQTSDITKAIVSPLPRVLMEGIHAELMKALENEDRIDDQREQELPTITKLLEVSINETGAETDVSAASTEKESKKIRCSECNETFNDVNERKEHFINDNKLPTMISLCCKCGILCPTDCSLKAHKRLHLQISPYVCPECGDNPDRYWENFQRHLKYKCLHYARSVGYQCKLCNLLNHSMEALKKHLVTKHTLGLVKCQICPMAFKTVVAFYSHRKKAHGTSDIPHDLIFKCGLCEVVFMGKEHILSHMETHIKRNVCQYVFQCPECNLPYESKEILHDHMQKVHLKIYSQYVTGCDTVNEVDLNAKKGTTEFNGSRIECLLCHCAFSSHQGYSLHVTRSHGYLKYPCGICSVTLRLRAERIMHGKGHLRNGIPLCLLCHNKPICPPETLDMHLLYHVERIKHHTICIVCGKGLFNFEDALQHLRSEHYVKNTSKGDASEKSASSQEVRNEENNSSADQSGTLNTDNITSTASRSVHKHEVERSTIKPKQAKYECGSCYKCDYIRSDREEFKMHILSHKASSSTFQCMECGRCYVTISSLTLHLKGHHHIFDTEKYLATEGTHHVPEKELSQEVTKTNALECSVCFETFASEALLRTHTRSHGTAFIQAMRASFN